jgi:lipoate-protein ligase A
VESAVDLQECRRRGIDVVRRMTGGRAVLHHHELTYAVIAPDNAHPFSPTVLETYMTIGTCLLNFFTDLGLNAQWVALRDKYRGAAASKHETASCFSAPSWYEITVGGKKICGSAQKRGDGVFLQHGSILIDHDPDELAAALRSKKGKGDFVREIEASTTSLSRHLTGTIDVQDLGVKLLSSFQSTLGIIFSRNPLTAGEVQLKELLRREKYETAEWNCRGSSMCAAVA